MGKRTARNTKADPVPLSVSLAARCGDLRPAGRGYVRLQLDEVIAVGPFQQSYSIPHHLPTLSYNVNVCIYINTRICSVIPSGKSITSVEAKEIYNWVPVPESSARVLRKGEPLLERSSRYHAL